MAISELNFLPTLPSLLAKPDVPFIHRDLSWLQFNERVLGEARDPKNPLLERTKFLGISSTNLDEFFMIRFSGLQRSIATLRKTNLRLSERRVEIRNSILETVAEFTGKQADTLEILSTELESAVFQSCERRPLMKKRIRSGKKYLRSMFFRISNFRSVSNIRASEN